MNDEKKTELTRKADEIKKAIDHLLDACFKRNRNRIVFWVGSIARLVTELGKDALTLTLPKKSSVILPGKENIS
jgi:hypothetical protein